jgi:hypothetical protein
VPRGTPIHEDLHEDLLAEAVARARMLLESIEALRAVNLQPPAGPTAQSAGDMRCWLAALGGVVQGALHRLAPVLYPKPIDALLPLLGKHLINEADLPSLPDCWENCRPPFEFRDASVLSEMAYVLAHCPCLGERIGAGAPGILELPGVLELCCRTFCDREQPSLVRLAIVLDCGGLDGRCLGLDHAGQVLLKSKVNLLLRGAPGACFLDYDPALIVTYCDSDGARLDLPLPEGSAL